MKKTPKMLEIEERIGEPIKDYLRREYVDEKKGAVMIGNNIGVSDSAIFAWLKKYNIETREPNRLPQGFVKPTRDELKRMYIDERMSTWKIAERLGISNRTVYNFLIEYRIEPKKARELPKGFVKPTRDELKRMYIDERMSTWKIGKKLRVSQMTVSRLLGEYEIETRDRSETRLPEGFTKPTKEELEKMYVDERTSMREIEKKLGVSDTFVYTWLKKYGIPIRSNKPISNPQFQYFLKNNQPALNLAGASLLMNGAGNGIESIILEAYQGTFKDRKELHLLLENNRQEIYDLVKEGLTNLGTYLGDFSLDERAIIPVLIGQAISTIGQDNITSSLEDKVVRILRTQYSPSFNENPQETLGRLEKTINQYEGKVKGIYQKLYDHYQEVMQLQEELQ